MAVSKKAILTEEEAKALEIIERGGKTSNEPAEEQPSLEFANFNLRIPRKMLNQIEKLRKSRAYPISKNQWIIQAILKQLKKIKI